jgi:hypothetical protein
MSYWQALKVVLGIDAIKNRRKMNRQRRIDALFASSHFQKPERDEYGRWIVSAPKKSGCCGGEQCQCKKSN